ncbi:PASTA domain-containing protein [Amycolatopsis acidiphila]|uniref:PASTA domain-containing protein n=1 Tax=Amycolatopsis acidiphila TaxID=715473 RepID=A0A558A8B3_9PSEU|nr:PASTA domain-containing protein [Amycolatopsis acidiphila]TVT20488.1 PASTA domain-containing protein [Amycolatopsis acidiphila]UIJ57013.1 PASTA domain-containing protein [Amycolatopsis acidiphila]GHG53843.1 hypothetical protein GCM10017788_02910 [Amycolatopsis acidiphila]
MGEGVGPWREGREAWARLAGWSGAPPSPADDSALIALTDVGVVRRLLDQAEFEAVRAARGQGKSWSEIAIRLGVTRQSAWERWRDVDESPARDPAGDVATDLVRGAIEGAPSAVALRRRRRSSVQVPNVIGLSWDDARALLHREDLVPVGPDPDGPPLPTLSGPDGVVVDQSPESGAKVPPGSTVRLWLERGGGSGVREPRRPRPDPKSGRKMRDEVTDETVN